ncbi:MAG TPA: glutamine synthetase type III [Clostridiales bacterium]|jgi:glutamine synthetase|nr:glutamine synthetase type III [Clostridiales bacterium]
MIQEIFGSLVFNEQAMRSRLPKETFKALAQTRKTGKPLSEEVADVVANAMKDWAVEKGCTHFTHWFQPLTGVTAEKHEAFLNPDGNGRVMMDFCGKELVRGEPDASSLPTGGLRATFEARGYTGWDPTSYAFIKGKTLYIPSVFISYSGEALDKKTPLLRSMDEISRQSLRILRLFQNRDVKRVIPTVGAEQEFFLIDEEMYNKRPDLKVSGRTLFGAPPVKGQELSDHYFGSIQKRVKAFSHALNQELWKLGVPCRTEHNETAPAQHEIAPVYEDANTATDHNQLMMDLLKNTAQDHGMVCLLHEKPFQGINGSGKHNNWSLCTDTGYNLLEPGETPQEDAQFLIFLCAVIKAVDEHQDLLRLSVATASNDWRLGGYEAPPAIISIFLGEELTGVLEALENHNTYVKESTGGMSVGVHMLPRIPKDSSDRNRTTPLAFSGNKFEFRSLGSSSSTATPNIVLNTIVANALCEFADILEKAESFQTACQNLIVQTIKKHKRIIFNGNAYSAEWVKEAQKRGLLNLASVPDCLPYLTTEKNLTLFQKYNILSEGELFSRQEVLAENYSSTIAIEGRSMLDIARRDLLPAILKQLDILCTTSYHKKAIIGKEGSEMNTIFALNDLCEAMYKSIEQLESALKTAENTQGSIEKTQVYRHQVLPEMNKMRSIADKAEVLSERSLWPLPSYGEILESV